MHFTDTALVYGVISAGAGARAGDIIRVTSASQGGTAQQYWIRSDGTNWVSMGTIFRGTWANKPSASDCPVGSRIVITDLGNTRWYTNGTRWEPYNNNAVIYNPADLTLADTAGTTDTVIASKLIPAGVFQVGGMFKLEYSLTKSSAVQVNGNIRLGTAGTTADTSIMTFTVGATNSSFGRMERYKVDSATTTRRLGSGNAGDDDTYDGGSNNQAGTVTVSDMTTNALYLTATLAFASAPAGGDNCKFRQFTLELLSLVA